MHIRHRFGLFWWHAPPRLSSFSEPASRPLLSAHRIRKVLELAKSPLAVFVKQHRSKVKPLEIKVEPWWSVLALKALVERRLKIPVSRQSLSFGSVSESGKRKRKAKAESDASLACVFCLFPLEETRSR